MLDPHNIFEMLGREMNIEVIKNPLGLVKFVTAVVNYEATWDCRAVRL